ncbi:MAG TPA: glycosyltransferase, partial [Burkholderiaceae bacterium]|nr:glycosyltransferase [Burkholderiaceae bacterium]
DARPVVLLASTREAQGESEEALLLNALDGPLRNALIVIVPRHPQRFDAVHTLARQTGLATKRRSQGAPDPTTQLWIGDSMGELPAYYAMADLAYIGGSLLPLGGQNLIEACACDCPVLVGPHTFNFAQATDDAIAAGAAVRVNDAAMFWECAARWLMNPSALAQAREAARAFSSAHRGATERTLAALGDLRARLTS